MSLSIDEIKNVSHLARIAVNNNDMQIIADKLGNIFKLFEELNKIDTDGIEPMAHPLENQIQILAEDSIAEKNVRDEMQAIVPGNNYEAGFYLVPQVIE